MKFADYLKNAKMNGSVKDLMTPGLAVEFIQPWYTPLSTTPSSTGIAVGGIGSTPQELITFTKEEWDKQEQEAELRQKKYDSLFEEYKSLNTRRNEEIERLKGLIEVAHKDSHILFVPDKFKEELWQQFKTENNL